jgi:hypothetical protein
MVPAFAILTASGGDPGEVVEKPMPEGKTLLEQFFKVLPDWNQTEVFDSRLIELEQKIMTEGPYSAAIAVRLFNYLFSVVFVVMVMFWVIFPSFCVGAAMMKSGFFHGQQKTWRTRLIWLGLLIGLPLAAYSAWAVTDMKDPFKLISGTRQDVTYGLPTGKPLDVRDYAALGTRSLRQQCLGRAIGAGDRHLFGDLDLRQYLDELFSPRADGVRLEKVYVSGD